MYLSCDRISVILGLKGVADIEHLHQNARFTMKYTDRVKLCEDGLYRWYYDLDMRKDRRMLTIPLKVLAVIGVLELVIVQFMPYHSGGMSRWKVMGIMAACFALITAITLGICLIQYLARNGYYRYRFEMGPDGVRVLMDEGDVKMMQALGTAASVMSLFASSSCHTTETMQAAENAGYTSYRSVRRAAVDRAKDCIKLKLLVGANVVFSKPEDFEFVKEYIVNHLKSGTAIVG